MASNYILNKYKEKIKENASANMEDANSSIITNFYLKGIKGEDKVDIFENEYNSEDLLKPNEIYPGQIYSFIYNAQYPSVYIAPDGSYINFVDKLPIVLITEIRGDLIMGINLNLCTPELRVIILNLISNIDPKFFEEEAEELVNKGNAPISNKILSFFGKQNATQLLADYLIKVYKADYSCVFRTYSTKKIRNINRLEIWQWQKVPFINYEGSIKGDILSMIWKISGIDRIKLG